MKTKLLNDNEGLRTFVAVLDSGEEAMQSLERFIRDEQIAAAQVTAIGAFGDAVLGFFDWETKDYVKIPVQEQVEVASFLGDVALSPSGEPTLHIHAVLGRRDGSTLAGHLFSATTRPTLEVIVTEAPAHLQKQKDSETGLALIQL